MQTQNRNSTTRSSEVSSSEPSSQDGTSSLNLPEVTSEDLENQKQVTSVTYSNSNNSKILGVISCMFIGIGVIIILIVLLSSRKSGKNNLGRKRYGKIKRKKGKHLLADRYYRNIRRR